jgi:hypothetical protein
MDIDVSKGFHFGVMSIDIALTLGLCEGWALWQHFPDLILSLVGPIR